MSKPLFISFEGPDGSGKSTIAKLFYNHLINNNSKAILTREPGGTNSVVAECIRNVVLDNKDFNIVPRTEALLFAASRAQHVEEIIIPSINDGMTVICDRYLDSSLAYQGHARGLGIDNVLQINQFAIQNTMPDITFFIDVSADVGMQRIKQANRETNRLDEELMIMHKKAYEGYQILINRYPERFIVIDGSNDIETVLNDVIKQYESRSV
ncbi:MAG: dTMP kinase [Mycoplasma sp.]